MLARKRFRLALYKLILLKNIVDNKVHKEKMSMLYAFEQLIINTEDGDEYDDEEYYGEEIPEDAYFAAGQYGAPQNMMSFTGFGGLGGG